MFKWRDILKSVIGGFKWNKGVPTPIGKQETLAKNRIKTWFWCFFMLSLVSARLSCHEQKYFNQLMETLTSFDFEND